MIYDAAFSKVKDNRMDIESLISLFENFFLLRNKFKDLF